MLWVDSKRLKIKRIYCIKCNEYRKFKNSKILDILIKKLVLSISYDKCTVNMKNHLKK